MATANPSYFVVYCVACGVVEERATTDPSTFEAFDVVLAWNGQVWSARCRKCGMTAAVREQPPG